MQHLSQPDAQLPSALLTVPDFIISTVSPPKKNNYAFSHCCGNSFCFFSGFLYSPLCLLVAPLFLTLLLALSSQLSKQASKMKWKNTPLESTVLGFRVNTL